MDSEDWDRLVETLTAEVRETYRLGQSDLGALGIDFNVPDEWAGQWAAERAAELVTQLKANTQSRLNELITRGINEGWGPEEMRKAITKDFAFSANRSRLIARTEMATAYNAGQVEALRHSPTQAVEVLDGVSGDSDLACRTVDGMVISIQTAARHLIQHPNCVRSFAPVVVGPDESILVQDAEFEVAVTSED